MACVRGTLAPFAVNGFLMVDIRFLCPVAGGMLFVGNAKGDLTSFNPHFRYDIIKDVKFIGINQEFSQGIMDNNLWFRHF